VSGVSLLLVMRGQSQTLPRRGQSQTLPRPGRLRRWGHAHAARLAEEGASRGRLARRRRSRRFPLCLCTLSRRCEHHRGSAGLRGIEAGCLDGCNSVETGCQTHIHRRKLEETNGRPCMSALHLSKFWRLHQRPRVRGGCLVRTHERVSAGMALVSKFARGPPVYGRNEA
jgi:hypothetical protein